MRTSRTIKMGVAALSVACALAFGGVGSTAALAIDQSIQPTATGSMEESAFEKAITNVVASSLSTAKLAALSKSGNGGVNNTNEVAYWNNYYSEYNAVCYKHEPSYNGDHGYVADNKRVVLAMYGATWPGTGWIALIVNGGSNDKAYEFPAAGDHSYVAPLNGGGNIPNVSHWIGCKGDLPEEPEDQNPTVTYDCVYIDADQHRALKEGDHLNITINGSQPINAYVDLNVDGGYNGLGLRINGHDPIPLTQAEVESGVIHYEYSKYLTTDTFTLEFIQSGATDLWPDLECKPTTPPPTYGSCPAPIKTTNVYPETAAALGIGTTFSRDNGTLTWDGASWIFSTPGGNDKITYGLTSAGFVIPLSQLTALSFEGVLLEEGSNPDQIVAFNIPVDVNGAAPGGFTTIVVEAVYNDGSFDAFKGGDAVVWSTNVVDGFPNRDTFESWKFFLKQNPDTLIGGQALLNQGGGNAGLVTRVTSFTVGNTVECVKYVPSIKPADDIPVVGTPTITVVGPDCECLYNTINYDIPVGLSVGEFTGKGSVRAEDLVDPRGDGSSIYGRWILPVTVLPGYTGYSGPPELEFNLTDPASLVDCEEVTDPPTDPPAEPPTTEVDHPGGADTGTVMDKPSGFVWPLTVMESVFLGIGVAVVAAAIFAGWFFLIRPRKRETPVVSVEAL